MNKAGSILEIIWFVMGGLLLFIGIDVTIDSGIGEGWYYLLFALLAFLMYYRRRRIRIASR
ncbi:MAG: hypothetical protein WD577_09790 [Bacteroidales bacterium]